MERSRGGGGNKLGDLAPDFLAKWKSVRTGGANAAAGPAEGKVLSRDATEIEQTLRSWRKGAPDVAVRKGVSVGRVDHGKRRDKPGPAERIEPVKGRAKEYLPVAPAIQTPVAPRMPKPLRERLADASADPGRTRISAAMSKARNRTSPAPVAEDAAGKLAILGLDFGTAFTKAVVRWAGRHYAVDWSAAVEGEDRHLLASVFSEGPGGICVLGAVEAPNWTVHDGIKVKILESSQDTLRLNTLADAVIFIALAFRYVGSWLSSSGIATTTGIRWRLHVGLPTKSWDDNPTTDAFRAAAQAGRVLALAPGPVSRAAAIKALGMIDQVDRPAVDVLPEFACQLYSYLRSSERREDLHALVDVGAGTLDVAYFNVSKKEGEEFLPVFSSEVERLGAHYLIAALAGHGNGCDWEDGESSLSNERVAKKIGCAEDEVERRRSLYLSAVAEVFNKATGAAMKIYPTSPAVQGRDRLRLFLCGGGSRIDSLRDRFERIAREAEGVFRMKLQVSEIVRPRDIVGGEEAGFDRLSVAYGLSQNAANIGYVMRSATLEPVLPSERTERKDRDEDR